MHIERIKQKQQEKEETKLLKKEWDKLKKAREKESLKKALEKRKFELGVQSTGKYGPSNQLIYDYGHPQTAA